MTDLILERTIKGDPDQVFAFVTQTRHLLEWWGPEGMTLPEHDLDLSRAGAWWSVMMNADGGRYKVSGEVIAVEPPNAVEFTWAWHDDQGHRGNESTVRFEVDDKGDGTSLFRLVHRGLADDESAGNHEIGWNSSFNKLVRLAQ